MALKKNLKNAAKHYLQLRHHQDLAFQQQQAQQMQTHSAVNIFFINILILLKNDLHHSINYIWDFRHI